jgi:hypothetical protein
MIDHCLRQQRRQGFDKGSTGAVHDMQRRRRSDRVGAQTKVADRRRYAASNSGAVCNLIAERGGDTRASRTSVRRLRSRRF